MATINITAEELLAEIDRLTQQNAEGFTIHEMSEQLGRSARWCREKIKDLMKKGSVICNGKRRGNTIDGRPCFTPVYILIEGN